MKKKLNIFSLLGILLALVAIWLVQLPVASKASNTPGGISFEGFPLQEPRIIEFSEEDSLELDKASPEALT